MKVKVRKQFRDKNTNEVYKIGQELDLTVERVNEILQVDCLIEIVGDIKAEKQEEVEQSEPIEQVEPVENDNTESEDTESVEEQKTVRRKRNK